MSLPRAILFDLFHTLICLEPGGALGRPTWEMLGVSKDDYERAFYDADDGRATGQVRDPVEALRLVAHRIDSTISEERLRHAVDVRARRFEHAFRNPAPATVDGVARLRAAGIRIALVSNASWEEIEWWDDSPLAPHFDAVVFSCAVGVAKPDPAIYEHALRSVGAMADDALFVGDGGSDEHRGARRVGIRPVMITGFVERLWPDRLLCRRRKADWAVGDVSELANRLLGAGGGVT